MPPAAANKEAGMSLRLLLKQDAACGGNIRGSYGKVSCNSGITSKGEDN